MLKPGSRLVTRRYANRESAQHFESPFYPKTNVRSQVRMVGATRTLHDLKGTQGYAEFSRVLDRRTRLYLLKQTLVEHTKDYRHPSPSQEYPELISITAEQPEARQKINAAARELGLSGKISRAQTS
tara:strand:+ start:1079 stop:1459 length:381 start_codon:yes stop_codon:yes gene_type:complete